jgi:hypothetical protein
MSGFWSLWSRGDRLLFGLREDGEFPVGFRVDPRVVLGTICFLCLSISRELVVVEGLAMGEIPMNGWVCVDRGSCRADREKKKTA